METFTNHSHHTPSTIRNIKEFSKKPSTAVCIGLVNDAHLQRICSVGMVTKFRMFCFVPSSWLRCLDELQSQVVAETILLRAVHHVGLAVPQALDGVEHVHHILPLDHLTHDADSTEHAAAAASVQAVDDGASLSLLTLLLPLVHLQYELKEGALGRWHFSVGGPAQVLELPHHQVALLRSGEVTYSEETADDVTIHGAGHTFNLDRTVAKHPLFRPVLRTALR